MAIKRHSIPVTVLTGFLGSGKTTLINRILKEAHGRRFAVIENEYGEINVDADLLVKDGGETVVQLTNGCVCCTVRGDLAEALDELARQRDAGTIAVDQVLIEPTGLADPGPIVRTFMAETELLTRFHLDGVVTLFDAVNGERNLAEAVEAQAQLGYADRILVTKIDLLRERAGEGAAEAEAALLATIATANSVAAVDVIAVPDAPWGEVFDKLLEMRGYQFDRVVLAPQPVFRAIAAARHTAGVGSVGFEAEQPLDGVKLKAALAAIDARYGEALWRIKGVLAVAGMRSRLVLQGVQGLMQATPSTPWRMFEPQRTRLVLIGRDLDRDWLLAQLGGCVVEPAAAPMH